MLVLFIVVRMRVNTCSSIYSNGKVIKIWNPTVTSQPKRQLQRYIPVQKVWQGAKVSVSVHRSINFSLYTRNMNGIFKV